MVVQLGPTQLIQWLNGNGFQNYATILQNDRDSAAQLLTLMPVNLINGIEIAQSPQQLAWQNVGLFYRTQGRLHEALAVFELLYQTMTERQVVLNRWVHKAMPLVFLSECQSALNYRAGARRSLLLSLIEDSISHGGLVPATSGTYFRLVWQHGYSQLQLNEIGQLTQAQFQPTFDYSWFPEWILSNIETPDRSISSEFPTLEEANEYRANAAYIRRLLVDIDNPTITTGLALERLAQYCLMLVPGIKAYRRRGTHSTDFDVTCYMEGSVNDFRAELGRYFICECKSWRDKADFSTVAKFARVLDSAKVRCGILFSKNGVSRGIGHQEKFGAREILKVFQDRGVAIIVFDRQDFNRVVAGESFLNLMRLKYEKIRMDLV
ncbi:MAG: hypothetical protein EKK48_28435 [Candidatus Melainabacteria bacterium]|nr:MAG: hypothetical protein EKK48_28435 [Candidatus Melainabacteria bacterium]